MSPESQDFALAQAVPVTPTSCAEDDEVVA
jgi:hypothetical protein